MRFKQSLSQLLVSCSSRHLPRSSDRNPNRNCQRCHVWKEAHDARRHAAQCTRECVKSGSDYALVVGDKVYTLKGDKAAFDKFAGAKPSSKARRAGL